jgi:hypothetical protein
MNTWAGLLCHRSPPLAPDAAYAPLGRACAKPGVTRGLMALKCWALFLLLVVQGTISRK